MRRQIAYSAAAVSGLLAISGVAACGSSGGAATAAASLSISPTAAIQKAATYITQHSFHFTATADVSGLTNLGALSSALGSAASGAQSVTVNLSGDLPKLSDATGSGDIKATFSGSGTLVSLAQVFTGGSAVEIRLVGSTLTTNTYVNIGQAIGGKHWLALTSNNDTTGQPLTSSADALGALIAAGGLKVVGAGSDGTVEVSGTVNAQTVKAALAQAKTAANGNLVAPLTELETTLAQSPDATLVGDFWLNPSTYAPTKATLKLTGVKNAGAVDLTLNLSDFGETVNVAAPSSSDTYTPQELGQRLLSNK